MRDDSFLYTGATSSSFTSAKDKEVKQTKKERTEKVQEKRVKLKPYEEIIKQAIAQEKNKLVFGAYPDEDKMTDEEFRTERRARRLAIKALDNVDHRLMTILRDPDGRK